VGRTLTDPRPNEVEPEPGQAHAAQEDKAADAQQSEPQPEPQSAPTAEDIKRLDATLREERKARLKAEVDLKKLRTESMSDRG
jgi:hypothetical protein